MNDTLTESNIVLQPISKDLRYGKAVLPWSEKDRAWVKVGGRLIHSRRSAGIYVERLNKIISMIEYSVCNNRKVC